MAFKLITFALLIAAANAGLLLSTPNAQPATTLIQRVIQPTPILQQFAQPILTKDAQEYDPNPQYSFSYVVQDDLTGDSKQQQETRSGDVVQGTYSLIDADGYKRTVDYKSDPANGFNAVVSRVPLKATNIAPQPAVKSFVAQPVVKSFVSQPLIKTAAIAYPQQQFLETPFVTTYSQ